MDELLQRGISDPDWIPIVGDRGWIIVTNDRRLRTRPAEVELAITHKLKVIHLHGDIGGKPAWEQLVRIATRWNSIQSYVDKHPDGPWWLSVRRTGVIALQFAPSGAERA